MNVLLVFHPQNTVFVWVYPQKGTFRLKHPQVSKKGFYSPIYEIKPFFFEGFRSTLKLKNKIYNDYILKRHLIQMSGTNSVGGMSPGVSGVCLCVLREISSACAWTGAASITIAGWPHVRQVSCSSGGEWSWHSPPMSGGGGQLSPGSGQQQQIMRAASWCIGKDMDSNSSQSFVRVLLSPYTHAYAHTHTQVAQASHAVIHQEPFSASQEEIEFECPERVSQMMVVTPEDTHE